MSKQYDLQIREGNNRFWEEVRKTVKMVESENLLIEILQKRIKVNDDYLARPNERRFENAGAKIFKEAHERVLKYKLQFPTTL